MCGFGQTQILIRFHCISDHMPKLSELQDNKIIPTLCEANLIEINEYSIISISLIHNSIKSISCALKF